MIKNCKQCSKEFEPKNFRGNEQNYCSKECRSKAGNERYKLKLMSNGNNTKDIRSFSGSFSGNARKGSNRNIEEKQFFSNDYNRRESDVFIEKPSINDSEVLRLLEQRFESKADAYKFELKYENALKEIELLNQKIISLELELDEEPEQQKGIFGILNELPEWVTPAIGKFLESEKVQKFVINAIPQSENT